MIYLRVIHQVSVRSVSRIDIIIVTLQLITLIVICPTYFMLDQAREEEKTKMLSSMTSLPCINYFDKSNHSNKTGERISHHGSK